MKDLTTDERKAVVTSFFEKLDNESWFDRPTVLHGCWMDCYGLATQWATTGVFQMEGSPVCGIIKQMITEHVEAQGVEA